MAKIELKEIDVEKIKANPQQPREHFDKDKLKELSESIKEVGLINPITVRKKGKQYEIVAGERRWKAHQIAKKKKILAIDKEYQNDGQVAVESLIENIQREDLNPIEQAKFIKRIKELMPGIKTDSELAKKIGLHQTAIGEAMRLLNMPTEVKKAVQQGKLAMRSASIISKLPEKKQIEIAKHSLKREEGDKLGRQEVQQIVEDEKLYEDAEPSGEYERTANDVAQELYEWFDNGTHLINELVKDMNVEDLKQGDKNQLVTSAGVLIFNTFPKLTNTLIQNGAKADKKILELLEKTKKK